MKCSESIWYNENICTLATATERIHLAAQNGLSSGAISTFQYDPTIGIFSRMSRRTGGTRSAKKINAIRAAAPNPPAIVALQYQVSTSVSQCRAAVAVNFWLDWGRGDILSGETDQRVSFELWLRLEPMSHQHFAQKDSQLVFLLWSIL